MRPISYGFSYVSHVGGVGSQNSDLYGFCTCSLLYCFLCDFQGGGSGVSENDMFMMVSDNKKYCYKTVRYQMKVLNLNFFS